MAEIYTHQNNLKLSSYQITEQTRHNIHYVWVASTEWTALIGFNLMDRRVSSVFYFFAVGLHCNLFCWAINVSTVFVKFDKKKGNI